ncbi:outer membrane beta-barrel protein [Candidatus Deferrimicrobium sp.]|uniref:outer membrane beta-barrel protein n=1 Tax=Candidatus Deferrimicrobium sp. TaxID=3060586 RepID=UPI002ED14D1F
MRKHLALVFVGLFVAATATAAVAADYDRYERGPHGGSPGEYAPPPPPPRGYQAPPPRHAQYGQPYFFGHAGVFDPNSDSDGLDGYDTGWNFDVGIGSRVSPFFAIDGTVGAYRAERGSDEATVVPLTIGGRFILPHPFIEPYVGAGLGLYFSSLKERPGVISTGIDDSSTDFGGYLSVGLDMWLNPRIALNFEGKYHWVNPTFRDSSGRDFDVNMSGWTGNLGIRVAF